MANRVLPKGKELLTGPGDWIANKFKMILVDMDDAGPSAGSWLVSGVTNVTDPVITTGIHGLVVGSMVAIIRVQGATGVNGVWEVASVSNPFTTGGTDYRSFTIRPINADGSLGAAPAAPGAYTSGGHIANLSLRYLSEFVPAAGRVATSPAITGKTNTNGVHDCDDVTWTNVAGDGTEAILCVRTALLQTDADMVDTAQDLISLHASQTGLPLPVNPGTVNWSIDAGPAKLFRL